MYTEEQIRNLVRSNLFDCIEDVPTFETAWQRMGDEERECMLNVMTSFWVDKFDRVRAFKEE